MVFVPRIPRIPMISDVLSILKKQTWRRNVHFSSDRIAIKTKGKLLQTPP